MFFSLLLMACRGSKEEICLLSRYGLGVFGVYMRLMRHRIYYAKVSSLVGVSTIIIVDDFRDDHPSERIKVPVSIQRCRTF
jgi:hypothetical protein